MAVDEFGREIPTPLQASPSRGGGGHYHFQPHHHHHLHQQQQQQHRQSSSLNGRFQAPPQSTSSSPSSRQKPTQQSSSSPPFRATRPGGDHEHAHASQAYAEEPLLCQVLWKEEEKIGGAGTGTETVADIANGVGATDATADSDPAIATTGAVSTTTAQQQQQQQQYDDYRRQYCLRYVRSILNYHLDDSWFRDMTSPLQIYRRAQQNQARASREATLFQEQVWQLLQAKTEGSIDDKDRTIVDKEEAIRLLDRALSLAYGRKTSKYDHPRDSTNVSPPLHVLSTVETCLIIHNLPHYVTDEQVQMAIITAAAAVADDKAAASQAAPVVFSSTPIPENAYARSALVVWTTREEQQAAWKRLLSTSSPQSPTTYLPSTSLATAVPRRSHNAGNSNSYSQDQNASVAIQVKIDATDAYGRREVDANGHGGAPTDLTAAAANSPTSVLPLRVVQCPVSLPPMPSQQKVTVLSASLSSVSRIPSDYNNARTIARALDARQNVPADQRLEALLPVLEDKLQLGESGGLVNDSARLGSLLLDTCLAYLRRVHLLSYYHGLSQQDIISATVNLADIIVGGCTTASYPLGGSHSVNKHAVAAAAASTVYLRLENADSLLTTDDATGRKRQRADDMEEQADRVGDLESFIPGDEGDGQGIAATDNQQAQMQHGADVVRDLLVERLDDGVTHALRECEAWTDALPDMGTAPVVSDRVDRDAKAIEKAEKDAVDRWIQDHSILDGDGRARCSFHFCHKLFKNSSFLNKHLLKKHAEFLKAEQAKCHDEFMMVAWDNCEERQVPDVMVDCGKQFGIVPSKVFGRQPDCVDPEPSLWEREQEVRRREEEARQRRDLERQHRKQHHQQQPRSEGVRAVNYVDVDEMKDEKIDVSFDNMEVPDLTLKKKKKKRKLL